MDDLRPAAELAHALVEAGIDEDRVSFALVRVTRSVSEIAAARAYLEEAGYAVLPEAVPLSTAYGIAHDKGQALTETRYPSLSARAEQVAQAIVDRLVELTAAAERAS